MDSKNASPKTPEQEYTILRIKRKRDEDVPDVLVVDKKGGKRRKSGLDVFQFAETIDEVAWKELEQDELRKRISAFSRSSTKSIPIPTHPAAGPSSPETTSRQTSTQTNGAARQYRVITQEARQDTRPSRFYPMPPKVRSHKEVQKASRIRIYDAELANPESNLEVDPEMEKFQELLKDYLRVEETSESISQPKSTTLSSLPSSTSGDYVYDIFYHRPSTLSEQAIAANMAIVTGLPPQFDDEDDLDSESEVEDEADEDSNAEDYYRNDYPDDEESSDSHSEDSGLYSDDDFEASGRFEQDH